jgi:hypothetical protein
MTNLYCCPRCGYDTLQKYKMKRHLYDTKNLCPVLQVDVELTDDIKLYVMENRVYEMVENPVLAQQTRKLDIETAMMNNTMNRQFYQNITEEYLQGTHKTLECGITDITTRILPC